MNTKNTPDGEEVEFSEELFEKEDEELASVADAVEEQEDEDFISNLPADFQDDGEEPPVVEDKLEEEESDVADVPVDGADSEDKGEEEEEEGEEGPSVDQLLTLVSEMRSKMAEMEENRAADRRAEEEPSAPPPPPPVRRETIERADRRRLADITDDEFERALNSREAFVDLMSSVIGQPESGSSTDAVMGMVETRLRQAEIERVFYTANPDLERYSPLVDMIADELNNSPEKEFKSVTSFINEVEKEVRSRYKLRKPKTPIVDRDEQHPALPRKTSGSRKSTGKPKLSEEERDMLDLAIEHYEF